MEELFSREDIEKFGFLYESDSTKCRMYNTSLHFDCNYYKDGKWTNQTSPEITDEWKQYASDWIKQRMAGFGIQWKYLNSVFVMPISPLQGQGVMCRRVYVKGH